MQVKDFYKTLEDLGRMVEERQFSQARTLLLDENPVDIAELFEEMPENTLVLLFRLMPKETASEVFSHLDSDVQQRIVEGVTDKELATILDELFFDDTVDFIEEMPANLVKRVLKNTDPTTRRLINQVLKYPEDSAGSLMTLEFMELKKDETVAQAIVDIRRNSLEKETIETCFVTSATRVLEGTVTLQNILTSRDDTTIQEIVDKDIFSVGTTEDQSVVADLFKKYELLSMPVVDSENRLVGVITIDDVLDVIEEENSEDIYIMGAVTPSEDSYLKSSVFELAKHRILWLLVLMISASITGFIIRRFDEVLSSMVLLAAYIPMLMDTGGNAGSQSATMIIRGLALGEIKTRDAFKIIRKEFAISLLVGSVLAMVNLGKLLLLDRVSLMVAVTICISLFCTVIVAKICGGLLPILAEKCKVDPAIMASPLITTIVDAVSLTIYFVLATAILHIGG
ncbi:magnesium transporter [Bittarella massiliensis]|uniref:Magnesium transporter MgtE n=2 Tax=Bittarella massiliensis (ex Durand et al. 2017) TaxID=1720313 RepID=A0ABW9WWU9_9FIRM|nr:magnesium transporter [Bittarella massiliensis (ex Durand et al. 2017)]MZL80508.1 magnesium transporter [Bittarella massiliensis (ex Durand et al. 2017)]